MPSVRPAAPEPWAPLGPTGELQTQELRAPLDPMGRSDKRALRVSLALPVLAALSAQRARPEYKELRVPLVRSELRDIPEMLASLD